MLFSILIYQVSIGEIERRVVQYQDRSRVFIQTTPSISIPDAIRAIEMENSRSALIGILLYINIFVLVVGGSVSYWFARRTLRPIEEAHDAQTRFVSDASHELRTPLAAMTTELEVALQDPKLKKEEMREILTSNLEEVQRLNKLSGTLLALSSGNEATLPQEPFDPSASLESVVNRFGQPESRVTLHKQKTSVQVIGNQSSIEELLSILIENALKYSPSDSTVEVTTLLKDGRLTFSVKNTGEGISSEHMPHIFDRFYRIDTARTGNNGYGLGLALGRQISNIHDAGLTGKSTPGGITEFSFSLRTTKKNVARTPRHPKK